MIELFFSSLPSIDPLGGVCLGCCITLVFVYNSKGFCVEIMRVSTPWLILICTFCLPDLLNGHKEEECIEVGFARSSFLTVEKGYQSAKEELLSTWKEEDENSTPSYNNLSPQIKNVTRAAVLLEQTSRNILAQIRKTRVGKRCPEEWLLKGIEKHVTPLIQLDKDLAESLGLVMSFRCLVGSPYPNVDGTCINEDGPDMGANGAKFLRLLTPISGKGGFTLRSSVNNDKSLPSAREVARAIRSEVKKPPTTSLFTEVSHFIALDSFSIPESPLTEVVNCCTNQDSVDCAPIFLEESDPLYAKIKCLNFKRSVPAQAILGHRESLSMVSTFLDATPVYGSTNELAFQLKEGYFGYLKYPSSVDEEEASNKKAKSTTCQFPKSFKGCFNLDPKDDTYLENLRLLLILEHNFIAESLAEINSHFDDALLYNEARRILIAEYNAIIYGEFVPLLVGKELAANHTLLPGSEGPGARFIPEVNPGILTSFALAAHRNPSMIDEWKSEYGKTDILSPLHYQSIRNEPYQDLLAMDIQRGRDHGLPSYASWRSFCDSGKQIGSFEDLEEIFPKNVVEKLRQIYQDEIKDLDVLIALLEEPQNDALVGKIFSCILIDQFARLKTGNRLYWEHETSLLTAEQRDAIRSQSSSAALLCRHFPLNKIAKNPFLEVSESNPEIECASFPKLNLTAWIDTSLIEVMKKKREEDDKKDQSEKEKDKKNVEEQKEITKNEEKPQEEKINEKDQREKEKERIREELIREEELREKARQREEETKQNEEEEKIKETSKEREKYNDEMIKAEERIREEMRLKEEKRGKSKVKKESGTTKKEKIEL